MTAKNITLDTFSSNGGNAPAPASDNRGTFEAHPLTAVIYDHEGQELATLVLEPRAYKPNDKGEGGCGWFASVDRDDPVRYKGAVPVTGQVRLSVAKLKIRAGDKVSFK